MQLLTVNFFILVICTVCLQISAASNLDTTDVNNDITDNLTSGLKVVYRAYQQCERVKFGDLFTCLKLRAIKFADRVLKSDSIHVIDGVSIVKSFPMSGDRNSRKINFEPLTEVNEVNLPADPEEKQNKSNDLLVERIARFFQTHSVQFDMPRFIEESRQLLDDYDDTATEEGRKKNKFGGLLMLGGLMKGGMFALGLKGLALLAGKALILAKIALVVSALVGLSKLLGGGGHAEEKTTYEIVKHPHVSHAHTYSSSYVDGGHGHYEPSGHDHYRRSLDPSLYPHMLAYRAQQPEVKA
ncbi:uncharacterized protein [Periplaneta americana]|uniref:uncharacterized protein n=1 Tax=Periplaneta americana TaxID=6978 RepID=UPI0037E6F933